MMPAPDILVLAAAGGTISSFAVTLGMRVRQGRAWRGGPSACDHCGHRLGFAETLPLISWAVARGRCSQCSGTIALAHPGGELAGAVLLPVVLSAAMPDIGGLIFVAGMILVAIGSWACGREMVSL